MHSNKPEEFEASSSLDRIQKLFRKTEEMREMANIKNKEVEEQFSYLKSRLSGSTTFLEQMKNQVENLKFAYQKKVMDFNHQWDTENYFDNKGDYFKNKEEMETHLDELKMKIKDLQQAKQSESNETTDEPESFQTVLEDVVSNLKKIDDGLYSSGKSFFAGQS